MKWIGLAVIAVLFVCAPGYGNAQELKASSLSTQTQGSEIKGEPAGQVGGLTLEERNAYEEKIARELDAIQLRIADLRAQAITGASQNKRMLSLAANNLQRQKIAAEYELTVLEQAPESRWNKQQAKLEKSMEQLRDAF